MTTRILSLSETAGRTDLSKAHIYRKIKSREFPKQVRIGERRIGFLESEIEAWLQAKVDARGQHAKRADAEAADVGGSTHVE